MLTLANTFAGALRRSAVWLLAVAATGVVAVGCATPTPPPGQPIAELPPPTAKQIVLLHTNDNWGEVDPCG